MFWYKHLYVGEKAEKHRLHIIQNINKNKLQPDIYVITPSSNGNNLLDIYPALTLMQEYYQKLPLLIVGIADGYQEALTLAGSIVDQMYRETGGFDIKQFLEEK